MAASLIVDITLVATAVKHHGDAVDWMRMQNWSFSASEAPQIRKNPPDPFPTLNLALLSDVMLDIISERYKEEPSRRCGSRSALTEEEHDMRKWIPILLAPVFQALIGYALWLLWDQFGDGSTYAWIDPNQLGGQFEGENIVQLKHRLAIFGAEFWLLGAVTSWVWLCWSRAARLYSPKNVASLKIVWWGCFALGGVLALVLGYLDIFGTLVDLRADLRVVFPAEALILLYVGAFWLVGSWLFTRPVARPAVPYASWVRMPWG